MKDVGLRLKEQREEVGFTLEEMSAKTKITIPQLRALEEGNLDFFKEDISYVPYFVRFYAQALYLDYETMRVDVDTSIKDLHHTQKLKVVAQNRTTKENIENRIKERSKMSRNATALRPAGKRKVDYSLLSLMVFIILLLIALIVIFFVYIYPMIIDSRANNNEPVVIALPQNPNEEVEEKPDEVDPTIPFVSAMEVKAVNPREYEITGYVVDEEVLITVTFARDVWMKAYINGVATDNPMSKIYKKDEVMEIRLLAKNDIDVMLHFGNLKGNLVRINNKEIVWDSSIENWLRGIRINFRFKGA